MFKKFQYNSPVVLTYTFLCAAIMALGSATNNASTKLLFTNFRSSFTDPLFYFRLFSYALGHVSWDHFFSNFTIILLVGPILEEKYGSRSLLKMMFGTALLTGIINITFFSTALIGASGIAFMFIVLSSFGNAESGRIPITFILIAGFFIGKEVLTGFLVKDNISHMAHIIGGLSGGLFGYQFGHRRKRSGNC